MRKDISILVLGLLVAAVAYFGGIPRQWETVILVTSGFLIALLSFLIRRDLLAFSGEDGHLDTFVQNERSGLEIHSMDGIAANHDSKEKIETKEN